MHVPTVFPSRPLALAGGLGVLLLGGCGKIEAPGLSDWTADYPDQSTDTDDTDDTDDPTDTDQPLTGRMLLKVANPYESRIGLDGDPEELCLLDTTAGYSEINCQAEVNELDAYFWGFTYQLQIDAGTCEYLYIANYSYEAWEVGTGEAIVSYKIDEETGAFLSDVSASLNGQPHCPYDYGTLYPYIPGAPNCCQGGYQIREILVDDQGNETPQPLSQVFSWGGESIGDCYEGAAYHASTSAFEQFTGLALPVIVDVEEDIDFTYDVSIRPGIADLEFSNLRVANYLEPGAPTPNGFTGEYAFPLYNVRCLDRAREVTGQIYFTVREWDEVSEYASDGDSNSGIKANAEADAPLEANGSGSLVNDYWDWADFEVEGIDWIWNWQ